MQNAPGKDFSSISELLSRLHVPPHGHLQYLQTVLPAAGIIPGTQHIFYKISPNFTSPCLKDFSGSLLVLPSALAYSFRNSVLGLIHISLDCYNNKKTPPFFFSFPVGLLQRLKQGPGIFI